jgi:hypothetical protein
LPLTDEESMLTDYIPVADSYEFSLTDSGIRGTVVFQVKNSHKTVVLQQKFCDVYQPTMWCYHVVINTLERSKALVQVSNLRISEI